jgi:hypothetical protein
MIRTELRRSWLFWWHWSVEAGGVKVEGRQYRRADAASEQAEILRRMDVLS